MVKRMSNRLEDSLLLAFHITGGIATVLTILGVSIATVLPLKKLFWLWRILVYTCIAAAAYGILAAAIWAIKGKRYKNAITSQIGKNTVTVQLGDIFQTPGWRVIPMDTTFSTVADDRIISKNSLHGQLVLRHGDPDSIEKAVKAEAERRGLQEDNGTYRFPLGTVIPYICREKNGQNSTYLMLALTALNKDWEAHTTMAQYEQTLMEMWNEIGRVYARHDIVLPLMGSGITRFDDDQDASALLLRCMLCTLNTSRIRLNAKITVVIYDDGKTDLPLYEYKDLFRL